MIILDDNDTSNKTPAHSLFQRLAAEMIAEKSVVVISGKGGCGKTEVVARV